MNAITTLLLEMLRPGDHVVMTSDCYRRTRQFIRTTLAKFGIEHSFVPPGDYDAFEAAIIPGKTRLLISELPTNPYLRVIDVARVAEMRHRYPRLKLLVDATLATPYNFRALEAGADLVLHSCTKYLAGHNDVLAGSLSGPRDLIEAMQDARGVFGGMPDPHAAYLLLRGLKTLGVRMRQHNESAAQIARFLAGHPRIEEVFYPGLDSHPDHEVARRQLSGFGGMISFLVRGDLEQTSHFIDACRIPNVGPSMGGVETLIEQTALISYYELSTEQRLAVGIKNNLVRLSVGLEEATDLIADLDQALSRL
jgi:cystathionine gamma-synthase